VTLAVALLVTFTLAQSGPSLDAYGPSASATMSARGSVRVAHPPASGGLQTQEARRVVGSIVYRIGARRLALGLQEAELTAFADGSRLLDLDVRVTASNDRACPVGSTGDAYLLDDAEGRDEAKLLVCPPRWEHYFNPLRGRIAISIRPRM
jgi:hypothetical protein